MEWLSAIGEALKGAFGLIDDLNTSEEEKAAAKIKMQELFNQQQRDLMANYQKEIATTRDVIVAELTQDDKFTKRARPAVMYMFILIIALNYCIFPYINHFIILFMKTPKELPLITLPQEAWNLFGIIFGVYGLGRSVEKISGTGIGSLIRNSKIFKK